MAGMYRAPPPPPLLVTAFGGRIFGLEPTTGRRAWTYETSRTGSGNPVRVCVEADRVYALAGGWLHVLEDLTGRLHGKVEVPVGIGPRGTLMVLEGRIYCGGGGAVACFDVGGVLLWSDDFPGMGVDEVAFAVPGHSIQADQR